MDYYKVSIVTIISFLSLTLSNKAVYSIEKPELIADTDISVTSEKSSENIVRQQARAITVKISAGEGWGSGIIIQRKGQSYTVLTNAHVLRIGSNYQIQTPDGKIYKGQTVKSVNFNDDDLGLLTFQSNSNYAIAKIAKSPLVVGDQTFAAGFPNSTKTWLFTTGKVEYILPKSFQGGYRVGYSNDILKGMSGGPVLNKHGELVAINGRHKFPLWGNPFVFQDGSTPNVETRSQFKYSSWAVPVANFLQSAPQFSQGEIIQPIASFSETDSVTQTKSPSSVESEIEFQSPTSMKREVPENSPSSVESEIEFQSPTSVKREVPENSPSSVESEIEFQSPTSVSTPQTPIRKNQLRGTVSEPQKVIPANQLKPLGSDLITD